MTGIICVLSGGGGGTGPLLDTQTVTRGTTTIGVDPYQTYTGYSSGLVGSISDGTSNIYGGASILGLYFYEESYVSPPVGIVTRQLILTINGAQGNSGWTTMKVGSTSFNRASALYAVSTQTNWVWNIDIPNPFVSENNPFTATTIVEWT
jgi:hypothetical protein